MRSQLRFCDLACSNGFVFASNSPKQAKFLKQPMKRWLSNYAPAIYAAFEVDFESAQPGKLGT